MRNWHHLTLLLALGCAGCRPETVPVSGSSDPIFRPPVAGTLRISFLDVGQGDCELVQAPGGVTVLIDGGPPEAGPAVLRELKAAGVERLDWIIGSHPHSDHIGGLIDVLREMPAKQALDPGYNHGTSTQRTYLSLLKEKRVRTTRARAGQGYDLGGGAKLEILAPQEPLLTGTDSDANNNSIVARLVFGETELLFTGDMEEDERARLLAGTRPEQLRSDVLKVAHHGSHNGTDPPFLRAVQPKFAVLSLARQNDYGHPHREALETLRGSGAQILRTDERGTIRLTSDGKQITVEARTPSGAAAAKSAPRPGEVIGNESSRVYHTPECGSLPRKERRVAFANADAAAKAGYHPHKSCTTQR
jgi:competence protein ComEC